MVPIGSYMICDCYDTLGTLRFSWKNINKECMFFSFKVFFLLKRAYIFYKNHDRSELLMRMCRKCSVFAGFGIRKRLRKTLNNGVVYYFVFFF